MTDTKSKAQACAEWLEYMRFGRTKPEGDKDREAAAELRRLDVENTALADSCAAKADRIDRLGEAVERLTLERDALLVDAERYRWLRARPLDDDEIFIAVDSTKHPTRWGLGGDDPDGCDAAIDAARSAE